MTKKQYTPIQKILPCNLLIGHIIQHQGIEEVVSRIRKNNCKGETYELFFEGHTGSVEYDSSIEIMVYGHVEQLEEPEPEKESCVNFEDRRHALFCATNFFAQKAYVEPSEITDFAEHFEQWLQR
jgi:hypothetical protein